MISWKNAKRSVVPVHICNQNTKRKAVMAIVAAASAATAFYHTADLQAATYTWTGALSTTYGATGNWGTNIVPTISDVAYFGTLPLASGNMATLTVGEQVGGLVFANPSGGWTLGDSVSNAGSLNIGSFGINDTANTSGTDTIGPIITLRMTASGTWAAGNGGTLNLTGIPDIVNNETMTIPSGTMVWNNWEDNTVTGVSAGQLSLTGAGTLMINGTETNNNGLDGGFAFLSGAGTVVISSGAALGKAYLLTSGGTLTTSGSTPLTGANNISLSLTGLSMGTLTLAGSNSIEFNANFTNTQSSFVRNILAPTAVLTFDQSDGTGGAGKNLQITGTGSTVLAGGVFATGSTATTGLMFNSTGSSTLGGTSNFSSLAAMTFTNEAGTDFLTGTTTGANVIVENSSTVFSETSTGVIANTLTAPSATPAGQSTFTISGGNATLAGTNTFSGAVTISGGTLTLGSASALGAPLAANSGLTTYTLGKQAATLSSGAVLDLNGQSVNSMRLILNGSGTGGAGAVINSGGAATIGVGSGIGTLSVTAGTGQTSNGSATIAATGITGFAATSSIGVAALTSSAGSGYTTAPTVSVSGGGGTGLTISTSLVSGQVAFTITNPGTGYTSIPTFMLTAGVGGSGANITGASLGMTAVTVTNWGTANSGYNLSNLPSFSVTGSGLSTIPTISDFSVNVTLNGNTTVGGAGDITIVDPIAGVNFGIIKTSNNTLTLSGSETYTGATTVNMGTVVFAGNSGFQLYTADAHSTSNIIVGNGAAITATAGNGTLVIQGNQTIGGTFNEGTFFDNGGRLIVNGGSSGSNFGQGTLSMVDGAPNTLTLAEANTTATDVFTIGSTTTGNPAELNMEVGATSDEIAVGASGLGDTLILSGATAGTTPNIVNLTGLGNLSGSTQTLISTQVLDTTTTGNSTFANGFTLGATSGNFYGYTLALGSTSNTLTVTETANASPITAYYDAAAAAVPSQGGTAALASFVNGNTDTSNFSTDPLGATNATGLIGSSTNVYFAAANLTTAQNVSLGQDFTINSLNFTGSNTVTIPVATTITSGNTLTINATTGYTDNQTSPVTYAAGTGLVVQPGALASVINANVILGASQTWEIDNAPANALTVNGVIGDNSLGYSLTKTGSGGLVLAGSNTYGGSTNVSAGTLDITGSIASTSVAVNASTAAANLVLDGANAIPAAAVITGTMGTSVPTININANQTFASLTNAGYSNFNAGTSTIGTIADTGTMTVASAATLNATVSFSEGMVTNSGTININAGTANVIASLGSTGTVNFTAGTSVVGQGNGIGTGAGGGSTTGGITGTGTLSVTGGAQLYASTITHGVLNIDSASTVTIADSAAPGNASSVSVLTDLNNSGTLDLKNNDLIVTDSAQYSTIKALINNAADGGAWDQSGITSSSARANSSAYGLGYAPASAVGTTVFDGVTLAGTETIVKYTLLGDTQLRGAVGIGDYDTVLSNYGTGTDWSQGNFHYSGVVGIGDYDDVLSNYGAHPSGNLVVNPALTHGLSPALSLGPDAAKSDLKLEVNTTTGDVYLEANTSVAFTGYTISDPSAHLLGGSTSPDPAKLLSVSPGNGGNTNAYETGTTYINWFKISETSIQMSEGQNNNGFANHSSRDDTINIPAGGTIDFGDIYNIAVNNQDISFDFAEAGTTPTNGPAYYGAEVDYVGGVATPEPASVSLLAIGAVGMLSRRRRRSTAQAKIA